ncbi:hypothetical protein PVAP13_6NG179206 [Panicum virgatum]|uniref:Uncharacterized protein n=1 Tax=Panicum virgatum TaxID=38727 RepID=A0A8T0QWC8_PANVG|nr:hypothetical protein PVAP13_6NG179206 [Panicum virgatum]
MSSRRQPRTDPPRRHEELERVRGEGRHLAQTAVSLTAPMRPGHPRRALTAASTSRKPRSMPPRGAPALCDAGLPCRTPTAACQGTERGSHLTFAPPDPASPAPDLGPGSKRRRPCEPPDHGPPPPDLGFDGAGRGEDGVVAVAAPTSRVGKASMLW